MSVGGNETSSRGHIFCEELQGEGTAGTREVVVLYILYYSTARMFIQLSRRIFWHAQHTSRKNPGLS